MRRRWSVLKRLSIVLLALFPALAQANGRFPRAQRLIESPVNSNQLTLAATYGLVISQDRGKTWHFVCEAGYASRPLGNIDVTVEMTSDGNLLADIYTSIRASSNNACEWQHTFGNEETQGIPDLLVSKSLAGVVLAVSATDTALNQRDVEIHESADNGKTWHKLGVTLPAKDIKYPLTLDEAPSDPKRLYVSGLNDANQGVLLRSSDRAVTWQTLNIATTSSLDQPYIAAVHPTNADILYVRTSGINDLGNQARDAFLYSTDAGNTWTELLRLPAKLYGFALAPDAGTLLLGYGNTHDPDVLADPSAFGIYKADASKLTSAASFTKIYNGEINCLTWNKTGLYACPSQLGAGFALGFRNDAAFTLETANAFQPLLKQTEIQGPLPCPQCAISARCDDDWSRTCVALGACSTDTSTPGQGGLGTGECSQAGASASGGAAHDAGGSANANSAGGTGNITPGTTTDTAGTASQDDPNTTSDNTSASNCDCNAAAGSQHNALGALFAAMLIRSSRRARTRRSHHRAGRAP